tara:strand:- start:75 stop:275 length:201 start_codon:yes stop_codon:yes gene_type:complete
MSAKCFIFLSLINSLNGNLFQKVFSTLIKFLFEFVQKNEKYRPHSRRELINNRLNRKIKYFLTKFN